MPTTTIDCLNIPLPEPHKGKIVILGFGDPITLYPSEYQRVLYKEDLPTSNYGFDGSLINTRDTDLFGNEVGKLLSAPKKIVEPYKYGINFEVANKDYLRYIKLVELARQSQDHVIEVTLHDYTQPLYEDLQDFVDDEDLWKQNWKSVYTEYKGIFVNAEITGTTVYERKPRENLKLEFVESQWRGAPVNPGLLNFKYGGNSVKVYPADIKVSLVSRQLDNATDGIVDISEFDSLTAFSAYKYRVDVTVTNDLLGLQTSYLNEFDLYELYKNLTALQTQEMTDRLTNPGAVDLEVLFNPLELGDVTESYRGILSNIEISLPEKDKKNSSSITFSFVEKSWRGGRVDNPGYVTLDGIRLYPSSINLDVIYQDVNGSSEGFLDIAEGISLPTFRAYKFSIGIEVDFDFFNFVPEYSEQYDTYSLFKQISDIAVSNLNQALVGTSASTLSFDWGDDVFSGYVTDVVNSLPKEGKKFGTTINFTFTEKEWRGTPPNPGTVTVGGIELYPSSISVTTLKDSVGGSTDNFIRLREALHIPVVEPYKYKVEITTDFDFFNYSPSYLSQGEMYSLFEDIKALKDLSTQQLKVGLPNIPLQFSLGGETLVGLVTEVSFNSAKYNPKFNSTISLTFIESDWRGLEDFEDICVNLNGVTICPSNIEINTIFQDVVSNSNGFRDLWEGKDIPIFRAYKYQISLRGKYGPTVAQTKFLNKTETYQLYQDLKDVQTTDLNNRATGNGANITLVSDELNLSLLGAITELSASIPQEATAYNSEISLTFIEKEWRGGSYQPKTVSIGGLEFIAENISVNLIYEENISGSNGGIFALADGNAAQIQLPYKYSVVIELSSEYGQYRPGETASAVNIYRNLQSSINTAVNCEIFDGDIDLNIGVISELSLSNPKNDSEFGSRVSITFVETSWRNGFTPYTARLGAVEFIPQNVSVSLQFDTAKGDFFVKKDGVWESNKLPYKYSATITYSSKFDLDSLSGIPSAYEIYSLLQAEIDQEITCSIPQLSINEGILTALDLSAPRENAEFGSTVTATITEIAWRGSTSDFFADFVVNINGFPIYPASLSLNREFDSTGNRGVVTDDTPFRYSLSTQTLSDLNEFRPPGLPSNLEIFKGLKASETTELECFIPDIEIKPGYITSLSLDAPITSNQYDYGFSISFSEKEYRNPDSFELSLKVVIDGLEVYISSLSITKEFDTSSGDVITADTPFRYTASIQGVSDNDEYRPEGAPTALEVFNELSLLEAVELPFITPKGTALKPGYITNISLNTPVSDNQYDSSVSFNFIEREFGNESITELGSYVTVGPVQFFASSISTNIEYDTSSSKRITPDTPFKYSMSFSSVNDRYDFGGDQPQQSAKDMFAILKNIQNTPVNYAIPGVNNLGIEAFITSLNLNNSVNNGEDDSSLSISLTEAGFRDSENSKLTLKVEFGGFTLYPSSFSLSKEFDSANGDQVVDSTPFRYSASISSTSDADEFVPEDASKAKDIYDFLVSPAGQSTDIPVTIAGKGIRGYFTNVSFNANIADGAENNSLSLSFTQRDFEGEDTDLEINRQITVGGISFFINSLSVSVEYDTSGASDNTIDSNTPFKYSFSASSVSDQYDFATIGPETMEEIFDILSQERDVSYDLGNLGSTSDNPGFITSISLNKNVANGMADDSFSISWSDSKFKNPDGSLGKLILRAGIGGASVYINSISVSKEYDTSGSDNNSINDNTPFKYSVSISSVSDQNERLPRNVDGDIAPGTSDAKGVYEAILAATGANEELFVSGLGGFKPGYFTNVSLNANVTSADIEDNSVSFTFTERQFGDEETGEPVLESVTIGPATFVVTSVSLSIQYNPEEDEVIDDSTPYRYTLSASSVSDLYEYTTVGSLTSTQTYNALKGLRGVVFTGAGVTSNRAHLTSLSLNQNVRNGVLDNTLSVSVSESEFRIEDEDGDALDDTLICIRGLCFYPSSISINKQYQGLSGVENGGFLSVANLTQLRVSHPYKYNISLSSVRDLDPQNFEDEGNPTNSERKENVVRAIDIYNDLNNIPNDEILVVTIDNIPYSVLVSSISLNRSIRNKRSDNSFSLSLIETEWTIPER